MEYPELYEYTVLSEDRRRAIEIFLKGFIIGAGLIAFGFKLLIDSKELFECVFIGGAGGLIYLFAVPYWIKCRNHNAAIDARLNELGTKHGFASVIPTQYIFDIARLVGVIVTLSWLGMTVLTIWRLKP